MAESKNLSLEELRKLLLENIVPIETWGVADGTKSLESLHKELMKGEAELVKVNGVLVRRTRVIRLEIRDFCDRHLVEVKQIMSDGRSRKRKLETTASEKLYSGEDARRGLERLFEEEFPFLRRYMGRCKDWEFLEEQKSSQSFPGLPTVYEFFTFTLVLSSAETPPMFGDPKAGLKQGDGIAFYEWQKP